MNTPLVSVIVPVYNIAPYIKRCVDSVLAQTYSNWELILVDDGSTDGSSLICDEQARRDERIKVIHQQNAGVVAARNAGVKISQGEWIMFIDGDDDIVSTAIEHLLSFDINGYDIISASYTRVLPNKSYSVKLDVHGELLSKDYIEYLLLRKAYPSLCAKLIRKSLFFKYEIDIPSYVIQQEDLLTLVYLSYFANKVYISREPIYNYYCREDSVSQSKLMKLEGRIYVFNALHFLCKTFSSTRIDYALFSYCLVSLFLCLTLKIDYISEKDELVLRLIQVSEKFLLSRDDRFMLSILTNKKKRFVYYFYNKVRSSIRLFCSNIKFS